MASLFLSLTPVGGAADPAVLAEFGVELRGKRAFVAGGEVCIHMADFAHAGNDGADVGIVQDETESHFRHGGFCRDKRLERIGSLDAGF